MNKQEQINAYLAEPIKIGDEIIFTGDVNGSKDKNMTALGVVENIVGEEVDSNEDDLYSIAAKITSLKPSKYMMEKYDELKDIIDNYA